MGTTYHDTHVSSEKKGLAKAADIRVEWFRAFPQRPRYPHKLTSWIFLQLFKNTDFTYLLRNLLRNYYVPTWDP